MPAALQQPTMELMGLPICPRHPPSHSHDYCCCVRDGRGDNLGLQLHVNVPHSSNPVHRRCCHPMPAAPYQSATPVASSHACCPSRPELLFKVPLLAPHTHRQFVAALRLQLVCKVPVSMAVADRGRHWAPRPADPCQSATRRGPCRYGAAATPAQTPSSQSGPEAQAARPR